MSTLKVLNGDIEVSKEEFQKEMENILRSNDKLNPVTQTIVYKIIDLYETAKAAKEEVNALGVLLDQPMANGLNKLVPNPAVQIQSAAIAGMSKLIAQVELDTLQAMEGDEDDI